MRAGGQPLFIELGQRLFDVRKLNRHLFPVYLHGNIHIPLIRHDNLKEISAAVRCSFFFAVFPYRRQGKNVCPAVIPFLFQLQALFCVYIDEQALFLPIIKKKAVAGRLLLLPLAF